MYKRQLHRVSEDYNVTVSLEPKPVKGDWNGAGVLIQTLVQRL